MSDDDGDGATVLKLADAGLPDDEGAREAGLGLREYKRVKVRALHARAAADTAEMKRLLERIAVALERIAGT